MSSLLKVILILGLCFAATFVIIKMSGLLTIEDIQYWLAQAKTISPIYVGSIIILLLFADLFIAVPTLTITILSGYFLGYVFGAIAALSGLMFAGIAGYVISRSLGERVLSLLIRDRQKREEAKETFRQHGFVMIMLSHAMPILPEVTACLAGMTQMPFMRFLAAWSISSIPYVLIASYAGSISSLENPKPAIFTAIGISGLLWIGWYVFRRLYKVS